MAIAAAMAALVVLLLAVMVGRAMGDPAPKVPASAQAQLTRHARQVGELRRDRQRLTVKLASERRRATGWRSRAKRAERRIKAAHKRKSNRRAARRRAKARR